MPLTSLLWGEEPIITHNDTETSTSQQHEQDEYEHEDLKKGRIRESIAHLIVRSGCHSHLCYLTKCS